MAAIRRPAVAGTFYPSDPDQLRDMVEEFLRAVRTDAIPQGGPVPKAIIAPHAGLIYSGPIAASAYARLAPAAGAITRVVLMGPSHRVAFHGLAVTSAEAYATPLGTIPIDRAAVNRLAALPEVGLLDAAHGLEHSLEVHLPFLQVVLGAFSLVPIVAGQAAPEAVARVLDAVWGGSETLVVISSDLSHYLEYKAAQALDARTCRAIETLDPAAIGNDQACGRVPVSGLLTVAKARRLAVETLDVRNSGDTAGPRSGVVGYGAWVFLEEPRP